MSSDAPTPDPMTPPPVASEPILTEATPKASASAPPATPASLAAVPPRLLGPLALGAALLAGLAGFAVGEATWTRLGPDYGLKESMADSLDPRKKVDPRLGSAASQAVEFDPAMLNARERSAEAERRIEYGAGTNRAMAGYGTLGAVLGLLLGIAGGVATRSSRRTALGGVAGLVLGAAAGVGISAVAMPRYYLAAAAGSQARDAAAFAGQASGETLVPSLLTHSAVFVAIGAAAGLALGLGLGGRAGRALAGGVMGAVAATALYEIGGSILFANARTGDPVATEMPARLLAHLAVALLVALAAAWSAYNLSLAREPRPTPAASPTPAA